MRFFAVIILVHFVLLSCSSDKNEVANKNEVLNIFNQYSLELPSYMSKNDSMIEGAYAQYSNLSKNIHFVIVDEPKEELKETFLSANQWDTSVSYTRNYYKYQSLFLSQAFSFSQVYMDSTSKFFNKESIHFNAESQKEEGLIHYRFSFLEGKEDLFMIIAWAEDKSKDIFKKDFNDITSRIREIKQ